jgi:hypothetical protein
VMSKDSQFFKLSVTQQLKIYSPLVPFLSIFIALIIFIGKNLLIDYAVFVQLCTLAAVLCLIGFFLTGTLSSRELKSLRKITSEEEIIARAREEKSDFEAEEKGLREYSSVMKSSARIEAARAVLARAVLEKKKKKSTEENIPPPRIEEEERIPPTKIEEEENLSIPEILGTGGIYGIVLGLGIIEALDKYVETTTQEMFNHFNNTGINQILGNFTNSTNFTLSIVPILQSNLPEAFRLAGFLFTIIPFVHGTILMFSKKWYHDTALKPQPHYVVALIYFIVVFIITIMYFFLALNIMDAEFFLYSLWTLMAFNSVWLVVYSKILKWKLKKQYLIHREWVFLNLNTLAFLSVILFAFPNLLSIDKFVESDSWLNFLILIILFGRVLTDYITSWTEFYQSAIKLGKEGSNKHFKNDTQATSP